MKLTVHGEYNRDHISQWESARQPQISMECDGVGRECTTMSLRGTEVHIWLDDDGAVSVQVDTRADRRSRIMVNGGLVHGEKRPVERFSESVEPDCWPELRNVMGASRRLLT